MHRLLTILSEDVGENQYAKRFMLTLKKMLSRIIATSLSMERCPDFCNSNFELTISTLEKCPKFNDVETFRNSQLLICKVSPFSERLNPSIRDIVTLAITKWFTLMDINCSSK
ncbi:hypothetical protein V1478_018088 [Vespula squamosa]|uniref:Uncharacterized protein n=1 Tax=Vespula squamosa TaxID=30214 RepID=A0ABD1ZYM1_VESSQ